MRYFIASIGKLAGIFKKNMIKKEEIIENKQQLDCFIIMPIADPEGYEKGHFKKVYEDIISVSCVNAGFNPVRADEVKQTNLIHLDILKMRC